MSILHFCSACRVTSSLKSNACGKCGSPFSKKGKYRVIVKGKGSKVVDGLPAAKKAEADLMTLEPSPVKEVLTLKDVWDTYRTLCLYPKVIETDAFRWRKWVEADLGWKRLGDVRAADVSLILKKMESVGLKPMTRRHVFILIHKLYTFAYSQELYDGRNPFLSLKAPQVDNTRIDYLSKEHINRLLVVLEKWHRKLNAYLVEFILYTGLRRSEAFRAKWEDVNWETGELYIRDAKNKRKNQPIVLNGKALGVLEKAKSYLHLESPFIFPNYDGSLRTDFSHQWNRMRDAAGLPKFFTLHTLRHTFASHLVQSGVPLYDVQHLLGHKSIKTTERYSHAASEHLKASSNKLPY